MESSRYNTIKEEARELYEEAKSVVIDYQKGSTSLLQRRLKIGYGLACALMDLLEDNKVIGGMNGAKPREVLIKK